MSTIGEKVQPIPEALASMAAIRALFSILAGSHEHEIARGIGKTVLYP
jgi:hypothetical protein